MGALGMKQDDAPRNYVGLASSFHDSALAIVDSNGQVVFAEASERPIQSKRALNLAPDIVHHTGDLIRRYCEPGARIVVSSSWSARQEYVWLQALREFEDKRSANGSKGESALAEFAVRSCLHTVPFSGHTLNYELNRVGWPSFVNSKIRKYSHHLTHAAAACFTSPFEEAVCAIADGYGEDASVAFYAYRNGSLSEIPVDKPLGTGSLGGFFLTVCDLCGFGSLTGEEWKVMGLAAYGHPDEELERLFRRLIRIEGLNIVAADADMNSYETRRALHARRRGHRDPVVEAADLAHTGQAVFTDLMLQLLNNLHGRWPAADNLVLGGGCALNSSTNGRILESTPFKRLHVFSAPADDGNAVGAALLSYYEDHPKKRQAPQWQSPYLGSSMNQEILHNVKRFDRSKKVRECPDAPLIAARMLSEGKIIGWIRGRAEFGPRALGNRSILADPRSHTIKDEINAQIKFREEYRPLAPAILHQFGPEYFVGYQESPYMERTLRFRPDVIERVCGVVHEDGTGRLQSVKREWNAPFHDLILKFHEITGIPLVLNTSFNVMGKPIAHSVEDAIAVFFTTGLDALFIEDTMIER
jgi:carbamoyltransferase